MFFHLLQCVPSAVRKSMASMQFFSAPRQAYTPDFHPILRPAALYGVNKIMSLRDKMLSLQSYTITAKTSERLHARGAIKPHISDSAMWG